MAILVESTTGKLGKRVSRSVLADGSALLNVKWNRYSLNDLAGNKNLRATVTQAADDLLFLTKDSDATADLPDTGINSYTGATATAGAVTYADANANSIQETIDNINGVGAGQPGELVGSDNQGGLGVAAGFSNRWRAGLGDFRPGFELGATTGLVVVAADAMLGGESSGLAINGDTSGLENNADLYSVGIGTGKAQSGGGQVIPDHFESDFLSDTGGNRFAFRNARRMREDQPGLAEFTVAITTIRADMVYGSGGKIVTIYDVDDNVLGVFPIAANVDVASITEDTPFVGPIGSPLFVEVTGVGALTDGPLTVTAEIRVA